jgi:hypothetical protein
MEKIKKGDKVLCLFNSQFKEDINYTEILDIKDGIIYFKYDECTVNFTTINAQNKYLIKNSYEL